MGEDAEPILVEFDDSICIGVFDGMGGAGSAIYTYLDEPRTGAYIAANTARDVVLQFFHNMKLSPDFAFNASIDDLATYLTGALSKSFKNLAMQLDDGRSSKLKSSLIKSFPTTMATMYLTPRVDGTLNGRIGVECKTFWAGDSRCYMLTPEKGLQQLSIDDIKSEGDALDNLINDSPISNCIFADGEFTIRHLKLETKGPAIFISATDGLTGKGAFIGLTATQQAGKLPL